MAATSMGGSRCSTFSSNEGKRRAMSRATTGQAVLITGFFVGEETAAAIDGITADENARFTDDTPAIRLCFAESGERIWDIAKQYRTDPDGIRAENETAEDTLDAPCVLLIPAPLAAQEE